MSAVYGNIKVDYTPCRSVGQLKNAAAYMLGKQKSQIDQGITKTYPDLYNAIGCNKDNFSNSILMTRKMHSKGFGSSKKKEILAHKMSISFHPDDNQKLDYDTAYTIGQEFAQQFFGSKGFEVLFAVHTDTEHIHVHYLISNCNINTGKSFRRGQKDLIEMSEYFGWQCTCNNLDNSTRKSFYKKAAERDRLSFPEVQMQRKGKETFKDELREAIQLEMSNPQHHSFENVIAALTHNYGIEVRIRGNTISYRHPEYQDKNGNLVSVRASKLGNLYTRKGIINELNKQKHRIDRKSGEKIGEICCTGRTNCSSPRQTDQTVLNQISNIYHATSELSLAKAQTAELLQQVNDYQEHYQKFEREIETQMEHLNAKVEEIQTSNQILQDSIKEEISTMAVRFQYAVSNDIIKLYASQSQRMKRSVDTLELYTSKIINRHRWLDVIHGIKFVIFLICCLSSPIITIIILLQHFGIIQWF